MSSSINARTNAAPLTLDLLREWVPAVKEGDLANQKLRDPAQNFTAKEKHALMLKRQAGSKAQEVLIISALPLIKNIASKEFQRRRAWSSRISYDDVLQEAIAGFIRGLLSYNENAQHSSATNYLGMWITTSIRRKVESLEHDFAIPYEVVERVRRVKAVTSRLKNEMLRNPTDEEVVNALNDPEGYANQKWRVTPDKPSGKKYMLAHVEEARNIANRSYHLTTYETPTYDSEETYERQGTPLTWDDTQGLENFEEENVKESRLVFFTAVFSSIGMGKNQKDIILRQYGMTPYSDTQTQKDIAVQTKLPPRFVKSVITSFTTYMPTKGGVFHKVLLETDPDLIESLEFGWLLPILGEWPNGLKKAMPAPVILTQSTTRTSQKNL